MSKAGLDVWDLSGDVCCSVVICVADGISSTSCQSVGDTVDEIVLTEVLDVSCGAMDAVVDVLVLADVAVGPISLFTNCSFVLGKVESANGLKVLV